MIRNRNGYWMSPGFNVMFAPDAGDGGAAGAGDGAAAGGEGNPGEGTPAEGSEGAGNGTPGEQKDDGSADSLNAEIARLKAEMAKQKAAMDKAASEASAAKKALKAKMTQEEIDAANKQEADEKAAQELEELRREVAKGKTVKSVMGKLGLDEETSGKLAEHLYGAADIDNALLEIQKAWQAMEKALRQEFGKIPPPGTGADSNSPEAAAVRRAQEFGRQRNAVSEQAQKALNAYIR